MSETMPTGVPTPEAKSEELKKGDSVMWTEEALKRADSGKDYMDSALVFGDDVPEVVSVDEEGGIIVKSKKSGSEFPANPKSLKKIENEKSE